MIQHVHYCTVQHTDSKSFKVKLQTLNNSIRQALTLVVRSSFWTLINQVLYRKTEMAESNITSDYPLHVQIFEGGNIDEVTRLLQKGNDVNKKDIHGKSICTVCSIQIAVGGSQYRLNCILLFYC